MQKLYQDAKWEKETRSRVVVFTKKNTLKKDTKYFLQNCYSEVGKTIFRQIIGIPMGSDPAPSFANLFQHVLK